MLDHSTSQQITHYLQGRLSEAQTMALWRTLLLNQQAFLACIIEYQLYHFGPGGRARDPMS